MNNNFHDFNEKEYKEEEQREKKSKVNRNVTAFLVLLSVCFFASYFIVGSLNKSKYELGDNQSESTMYNNTKDLSDDMEIVLKLDGVVEESQTLKNFKTTNDIDSVNAQFLVNYYTSKGYTVESLTDETVILNKDENSVKLEPNKYYLGEKDGYFAIYKSDENGKLFIENESDIYKNSRMVNTIPTNDQEDIKNYRLGYDTKDEVKEILSGYIS